MNSLLVSRFQLNDLTFFKICIKADSNSNVAIPQIVITEPDETKIEPSFHCSNPFIFN